VWNAAPVIAQTTDSDITVTINGGGIILDFTAVPEKRIPLTGNDDSHVTIEVRNIGSTTPLFTQTVTTDTAGTYSGLTLTGLTPGTYDITAKAFSHLRRKKSSISLLGGTVVVDFTDASTNKVLCGDVNTASPSTNGDNKVNGIDLTLINIGLLGSSEKLDLNQDGKVNGIDLTCAITNLTRVGDA